MPSLLILQKPKAVNQDQANAIREMAPDLDLWMTADPMNEDPERINDVEIGTGFKPPRELILNGRLKWYHAYSAGLDWMFEFEDHQNLPMTLTNSSGIHGVPMSEHAFAMILAHNRKLPEFIRNQSHKHWKGLPGDGRLDTLEGKTMLILGVGAIGTRMAKLAQAHDMQVMGIRRQPERGCQFVDEMHGPDKLNSLLPRADIIVCLLPNTPDSRHILGPAQFALMKRGVFIANLGRGIHIDENAMIAALQDGIVAGAGLDTFETEPLPSDSPLWAMENVIISPHCSGFQPDYGYEARRLFIRNLKHFASNETMFNVVDKELGYSLSH
ncbi:MAG: D-2-hydroxyacid dehydrogenase [Verrucomicrobia bacterium]|nr:D-2-hydroxyacid dehydrogenase [Verrucomicrobiota bacterium]MDA1065306.1 D-2-hydroxyacid dehydrogenase [Verrucomicrobiota bacterium]